MADELPDGPRHVRVITPVTGQCNADNGQLKVLLHLSAHISKSQQNGRPSREEVGGTPPILHTPHENTTRIDALPLSRFEPEH